LIELGKVVGVWGIKGWVKLHSYTRERNSIAAYKNWLLKTKRTPAQTFAVTQCRTQGQGIVAKLNTIDTREQAEALIGSQILIPEEDLPDLPAGEYYWYQLIGLTVVNDDQTIGTVKSIMETGANDVLVCSQVNHDSKDVLVPYTPQVVLAIDLELKTMTVDWDPSYLE